MNYSQIKVSRLIFLLLLSFQKDLSGAELNWPKIKDVQVTYRIFAKDIKGFDIPIFGLNGKLLYDIKCYPGGYSGDKDFDYSGFIDCRLISKYSEEKVSTLFADSEDQTSDWENRGRFLPGHLYPGCAEYPDWGAKRTFLLRGMKITLELKNIRFDDATNRNVAGDFDFSITVINHSGANSALSEFSNVKEPYWFYHPNASACSK